MCSGSEAGSYLRLIDSFITQLKAQGPSRTCNESEEEEEADFDQEAVRAQVVIRPSTGFSVCRPVFGEKVRVRLHGRVASLHLVELFR